MFFRRLRFGVRLHAVLLFELPAAKGHMQLITPFAINSEFDPQTLETNKDYSMTAPLLADGFNWPCKLYANSTTVDALKPVATVVSGQVFEWGLAGRATHNGGSCQVGVSYDLMATNVVLASYIGGCPLAINYTFTVPELPQSDKAIFWWAWVNNTGNREYYQNCAVVAITGTAETIVGPEAYKANLGSCVNTEGVDDVYPNPGTQVTYGGSYAAQKPTATISFSGPCTFDNNIQVTMSAGGGKTGVGTASGVVSGQVAPTTAALPATSASSPGVTSVTTTGTNVSLSEASPTSTLASPQQEGNLPTSPSTVTSAASSTSSPTSDSIISGISDDVVYGIFGGVLLVLLIVIVCLLRKGRSNGRRGPPRRYEDVRSGDSTTDDSTDDVDEKPHRRHQR